MAVWKEKSATHGARSWLRPPTHNGHAIRCRYDIPWQQDVVGGVCRYEAENDGRDRGVDG
jgi:hypothetical protein